MLTRPAICDDRALERRQALALSFIGAGVLACVSGELWARHGEAKRASLQYSARLEVGLVSAPFSSTIRVPRVRSTLEQPGMGLRP